MAAHKTKVGTPRTRLSSAFLESLEKDFQAHREEVIEALRKESPKAYAELLGRLVMTSDPPGEKGFGDCNSMRDIGERLLLSVGMSKEAITDELVDLAAIANTNFVNRLEEIAGTAGKRTDLN